MIMAQHSILIAMMIYYSQICLFDADDIIADRRKEQSKALSGKKNDNTPAKRSTRAAKKTAIADRSVATGRAKRAAAAAARRGLAQTKKPTAMEVEKEVYRQSRKTAVAKKAAEKKATKGRVPPNSSLREKNNPKKAPASKTDPPGNLVGRMPQQRQIRAAIQGMESAGCPMPPGFQLVMQFAPMPAASTKGKAATAKKTTTNNNNKNNNNTKKKNTNTNNKNANNKNANGGRKNGGRGKKK